MRRSNRAAVQAPPASALLTTRLAAVPGIDPGVADGEAHQAVRDIFGRGSGYLAVWAVQPLSALLVTPVVTRLVGGRGFGAIASAVSLAPVLATLANTGLPSTVQRVFVEFGGPQRARRLLALACGLALTLTGLEYALRSWWGGALGFGRLTVVLDLALVWGALLAVTQSGLALLRSQDRLVGFATVSLAQTVLGQALGIVFLMAWSASPRSYLAGLVVGQAAAAGVALLAARPRRPHAWGELREYAHAFRYGLPLVPHFMAVVVLASGDRFVILRERGPASVATYQLLYTIASIGILLLGTVDQIWEPRLFAISSDEQRWAALRRLRSSVAHLLLPLVVSVTLGGPAVLRFYAPGSYHLSRHTIVVFWVAMSALPYALYLSCFRILLWRKETHLVAWVSAAAAVSNLALNVVLVRLLGIEGSAIATLLSYTLLCVAAQALCRSRVRLRSDWRTRAVMVTTVGAGLGASLLPSQTAGWLALRLTGAAVAGLVFLLLVARLAGLSRPTAPLVAAVRRKETARERRVASADQRGRHVHQGSVWQGARRVRRYLGGPAGRHAATRGREQRRRDGGGGA